MNSPRTQSTANTVVFMEGLLYPAPLATIATTPFLVFAILATLVSPILQFSVIRGAAPLRIPALAHPSGHVVNHHGRCARMRGMTLTASSSPPPTTVASARAPFRILMLDTQRCCASRHLTLPAVRLRPLHRPQRVHCPPSPARPPKLEVPVTLASLPFPCSVPPQAPQPPRLRLPVWAASPSLVTLLCVPLLPRTRGSPCPFATQRTAARRESIPPSQEPCRRRPRSTPCGPR